MGTPEPVGPGAPRAASRLGRRDLMIGGVGGLAGLAAGVVAGRTLLAKPPPPHPDGRICYGQYADDLIAADLLNALRVEKPTYMDIGALDPIYDNNTYLFYLRGSRGVLVEPNMAFTERLKAVRPEDTVLVAGIGIDDSPEGDYYMLETPHLNTFDKKQVERLIREGGAKLEKVVKTPLLNINKVIAEHFGGKAPDFISIDIEGLDYPVLKTLDFKKYRPKLICAETLITNTLKHNEDTTKLLIDHDYEVRGMTFANTFYMDKKLLG